MDRATTSRFRGGCPGEPPEASIGILRHRGEPSEGPRSDLAGYKRQSTTPFLSCQRLELAHQPITVITIATVITSHDRAASPRPAPTITPLPNELLTTDYIPLATPSPRCCSPCYITRLSSSPHQTHHITISPTHHHASRRLNMLHHYPSPLTAQRVSLRWETLSTVVTNGRPDRRRNDASTTRLESEAHGSRILSSLSFRLSYFG